MVISHVIDDQQGQPVRSRGLASLTGLAGLAASVAAGARRAGAPPPDEGRRYRPHLTLARSRQPADVSELLRPLSGFGGQPWTATRICLVRSQGGPEPRYDQISSWPLGHDERPQ